MANAMEKMVAQMLGFTPEQMHETLAGIQGLASDVQNRMIRIEAKQDEILARLKGTEDGTGNENRNGNENGNE